MRVEMINDNDMEIFINSYNYKDINNLSKDSIIDIIKEYLLIANRRYKLNLNGFYKIKAYFNKKIGLFLNVVKVDDNEFLNEADFRIILFQNEKFLFEVEDYDLIKNISNKFFYRNKFYVDVEEIEDINKIIDMGRVIYGDESRKILQGGKNV